jgi:FkbM family methyltransferase
MNTSNFKSQFGKFIIPENEEWISKAFQEGGHWEEGIINTMLKVVKPEFTIISVGTHCGTTILPLAKKVDRVFCFEPQTALYSLLLKNISKNKLTNVVAFNGAVSNSEKSKITISGTDHYGRSLESRNEKVNYGGVSIGLNGEEVYNYRLDYLFSNQKVDVITIDVEGAEELVILGGKDLITKNRPIILMEQNHLTVTKEMEESLETNERLNIKEFLDELQYHEAIDLGDSNFLYLPDNDCNYLHSTKYTDEHENQWEFEGSEIYDITGTRGLFDFYYLDDSNILVNFGGNIVKGTLNNKEMCWSNGTNWTLSD